MVPKANLWAITRWVSRCEGIWLEIALCEPEVCIDLPKLDTTVYDEDMEYTVNISYTIRWWLSMWGSSNSTYTPSLYFCPLFVGLQVTPLPYTPYKWECLWQAWDVAYTPLLSSIVKCFIAVHAGTSICDQIPHFCFNPQLLTHY